MPVLLVAGDDVAVAETSALLPGIAMACLKSSYGFQSTNTLSPRAADRALREGVEVAVGKVGTIEPHVVPGPIDLELRLRSRLMVEWLSYLQGVERTDAFTIRHACPDIVAVSRFLQFLTSAKDALA